MAFDYKKETREGVLLGVGFIVLNLLFGISIGFPLLSFSDIIEKYGIVSILAPIIEELLFATGIFILFGSVLKKWQVFVLSVVIFTGFHYYAYGASFAAANAAFIGAAIYRSLANYIITDDEKDLSRPIFPLSGIIAHMIINTYLVIKLTGLVIVGVG